MILVTLGTQDKKFTRLLDAIEKAVEEGTIQERVVVQAGYTPYQSSRMEIFDYLEQDEFRRLLQEADLVITHGGVGTIMTALKSRKKILAAARLAQYKEHLNDHQTQLLETFEKQGYLIYMRDLSDIRPYLEQAKTFQPREYASNTSHMISLIEDWIDTH